MCGIYCVVGRKVNRDTAINCINAMTHRGPDGWGIWQNKDTTLGHRRLSILDLTDSGHQPMSYANERYWLTFNGEIYNFIEIREELKRKGYHFFSETDSEVILAAFIEWGEQCVEHFNGMWAFCIWDKHKEKLFVSRDRFGVKPLFYVEFHDGSIALASEMKALIPMMENISPNRKLFNYYRHYLHYENQENCLIEGIKRFPAGSLGWYFDGKLIIKKWWNTLDHLINVPNIYEDQVEQLRELFLDACKIRMRSDVTIGTALSGGVDSSATLCGMCWLSENSDDERMNKDSHHAYVACFPDTFVDETKYAKIVIDYLNINNTYINMNKPVSESAFLNQIYLFEELWESPQTPMMELYRWERMDGTKVSIDGHAADELFAGYEFDLIKAYFDAGFHLSYIDNITQAYLNQSSSMLSMDRKKYLNTRNKLYFENISKYYIKKMLGKGSVVSSYSDHLNWKQLDNLNKTLFVSTHETILPTMLRNYDRNSMANGVEIRMPFLDYRIVEFAFSIGWHSKIHNGYSKSIIRDAISSFTPKEIAYRRTKIGFNAPNVEWLKGIYKDFYLDVVHSASFHNCELVENPEETKKNIYAILNGERKKYAEIKNIWNEIQAFLWETAFLKRQWK